MVWINDLDSTGCNVFVDGTIKSVSCDFMLPTLCEMDEHVRLTAFPSSVAELSLEVGGALSIYWLPRHFILCASIVCNYCHLF